jgi:Tol biopolymer transport system component
MRVPVLLALFSGLLLIACQTASDPNPEPFAWVDAGDSLTMVGPGTISRADASLYGTAYTPTGDTLFFNTDDRGDGESGIAMVTRTDTGWTMPRRAPFDAEEYDDRFPSIAAGGEYVVFGSDRPSDGTGEPMYARDFYRVSRASGWTDVERMTATDSIYEMRASVANDGTIYYWTFVRGEGIGFYRGVVGDDGMVRDMTSADSLLFPDTGGENNPYIDPEKRFILFATWGREEGYGGEDLYLATRNGDGWSMPVNLGAVVNSAGSDSHPYVTPGGRHLFLTSSRLESPADTVDNWNHYVIRTDAVPELKAALE